PGGPTRHADRVRGMQGGRRRQSAAMANALKGLGPIEADPTEVSKGFLKHLDTLETERDRLAGEVPTGLPANEAGAALRENTQKAGDQFRGALDRLKASIPRDLRMWT